MKYPAREPGDPRRGARLGLGVDREGRTVTILGYGVYEGRFPLGAEAAGHGVDTRRSMARKYSDCTLTLKPDMRFRLDNGDVVWGPEVLAIYPEKQMRKRIAEVTAEGWTVIERRIGDIRAEYVAREEAA